jgi:hypothetical protein
MPETMEKIVASLFWDRNQPPPVDSDLALWRVMNLGDWDAILLLEKSVSGDRLERLLREAPAGSLSRRSRRFWQVRLGLRALPEQERLPGMKHDELAFRGSG